MKPTDVNSGLTRERLCDLLDIYPASGHFVWKEWRGGTANAGSQAGTYTKSGDYWYLSIKVDKRFYLAHRLMWLYVHGRWPTDQLDHKNLDKTDNRISNLREATSSQNNMNAPTRKDNLCGLRGVSKRDNGYIAQIAKSGVKTYLGYFSTAMEAHESYCRASKELHGEFSRT